MKEQKVTRETIIELMRKVEDAARCDITNVYLPEGVVDAALVWTKSGPDTPTLTEGPGWSLSTFRYTTGSGVKRLEADTRDGQRWALDDAGKAISIGEFDEFGREN